MSDSSVPFQSLVDIAKSPFWHPYTPVPHLGPRRLLVRAEGSYVYEANGHKLFDGTSSWWCQIHGHCHPRLVQALSRQAAALDQVLVSPHSHPTAEALSAELVQAAGAPFEKVFFTDNGSTAVEVALKAALQYWKLKGENRTRFLSLDQAYHGDTLGAMSVGCPGDFKWAFPTFGEWTVQAPTPYGYRSGMSQVECEAQSAARFLDLLDAHGSELAAVIFEPLVMGAGGLITYSAKYLEQVVSAARARGILVIFDEVFTGFGRTGTLFAYEQIQTRPDFVCLSKGLTSGMLPLGATLVREGIFEVFKGGEGRRLAHGHTFTANGLSTAVALESLRMFFEEKVIERNQELVEILRASRERFEKAPFVGEVRQQGMIWALELVRDKQTREVFEPANALGWRLAEKLWEKGVWVRPLRQVLYLVPPFSSTSSDLQHALSAIEEVLYEPL